MNATWLTARLSCWNLGAGADLASIHSDAENKFLGNLLENASVGKTSGYWIGLLFFSHAPGNENGEKVFWADDSPLDFGDPHTMGKRYPWYDGHLPKASDFAPQPDNAGGWEHCTYMMAKPVGDFEWADFWCAARLPGFVCRKVGSGDKPLTDFTGSSGYGPNLCAQR